MGLISNSILIFTAFIKGEGKKKKKRKKLLVKITKIMSYTGCRMIKCIIKVPHLKLLQKKIRLKYILSGI